MLPEGIPSYRPVVRGVTHMVSAGHYLASAAGYRILEEGGNAVDAGVASGIAIDVTLPHMAGFGGVAPIILHMAHSQETVTISGLGKWPKNVSSKMFTEQYGEIPRGIPRSVVPAACDAWLTAIERYGTMSFEQVVKPALELAEVGFPISQSLAYAIEGAKNELEGWSASSRIFMPKGKPLKIGEKLVQSELADVFKTMITAERTASGRRKDKIRAARNVFYRGEIADRMIKFCQQEGGHLTPDDLSEFSVKIEDPEKGSYKGYDIMTCGPWCQGPVLIQLLNIVENLNLNDLGLNSADYVHTLTEATKLAFADREAFYGDPEFVTVPINELLSKEYASERASMIDKLETWREMPPAGDPFKNPWEADTSYTCVVDRWGNAFSATPSDPQLGTPLVPGLGFAISDRGSQSWLDNDHPSSLEPGKRPRLTPNPALSFKDGKLFAVFGTPGGDAQVQTMAQVFLNIVEFGMDPQQAVEQPRFISLSYPNSFWPHIYLPGRLGLEGRVSELVSDELIRRGHKIDRWQDWTPQTGGACAIVVGSKEGTLEGGADPRRESYAIGR
jgi:gamma-glutamyltranspeptidase/glutathione hydrolase